MKDQEIIDAVTDVVLAYRPRRKRKKQRRRKKRKGGLK